jgi:hypothetical protein
VTENANVHTSASRHSFAVLFPVQPAVRLHRRDALVVVAAVVIGTFAQVIRLPGDAAYNTIWAEDGSVFLNQAINQGVLHAFTIPYAGYLHLVPRVLATVAALLPLQWAAAILGVGSALVVSLLVSGSPFRDYGPRWDAQLRSAAISCATDRLSHVSLSLLFRKYIIVVPCDRITEAAP